MELGFEIHSQQVFGWGERTRDFMLVPGEYTIWPTGIQKGVDNGQRGGNTYGDHPFVLARLTDKSYIGLFFKNSNAKVLRYLKEPGGRSVINFRAIGGILDVFAFMGDTAEDVLKEYHRVVGTPHLPPLWSLGFQQGSSSYRNDTAAQLALAKYKEAGIPLEGLWLDESYMDNYRPFEVSPDRFKNVKTWTKEMKNNHQYLGLSLHPCVPVYGNNGELYSYFTEGKQQGVFIRSSRQNTTFGGDILIGEHLPGKCAFLDPNNWSAYLFHERSLANLWGSINFDTLQLNYNEFSQFCDGECPEGDRNGVSSGRFSDLPYNPLGDNSQHKLYTKSLSLDAIIHTYDENYTDASVEFNAHGTNGAQNLKDVQYTLEMGYLFPTNGKRALVMSRSTFSGAGQYGGHWTGDNSCTFEDMRHSVSQILNFQLFGMPMTGANICGNLGPVNQEVCGRWYQLAAFYPFARSYFDGEFGTKEAWALEPKYRQAAQNALYMRLSLLRYYYTILYEIHRSGGSFWRPLFFEFPNDNEALKNIEQTFMIGPSIKVTPVLQSLKEGGKVESYFPANTRFLEIIAWNNIIDGGSNGRREQLTADWDFPLAHIREGRIIPYQEFKTANTTFELVQQKPIDLLVFPDRNQNAEGTLYVDFDGISTQTLEDRLYQYYKITFNERMMRFVIMDGIDEGGRLDANQIVNNITIVDAGQYNDTNFACQFNENMEPSPLKYTYDSETKRLHLSVVDKTSVISLRTLRGIQFGNNMTDQNFCTVQYKVSNIQYSSQENGVQTIQIDVEPTTRGMYSFITYINLIKDNLINVDMVPQISPSAFNIPEIVLNKTLYPFVKSFASNNITQYVNLPQVGDYFWFEIHVKDAPTNVLFSTKNQNFVYGRYFKTMGAKIATNNRLFGLGERHGLFWLEAGTYTVWNRDNEMLIENGEPPGKNSYGSHPVFFSQMSNKQWFGIYEHNSGPQDFILQPARGGMTYNNIKTTGKTNIFFMMNDSIDNVMRNYHELIGRPPLPPAWAFGWHQSRFGYNTTQSLREVYEGYRNKSLPLDAIWSDVDLLEEFRDFTVDQVRFKGIKDFVKQIQETGVHYVPIVGSGISAGVGQPYNDGKKQGVFIRSPVNTNDPLLGRSTPGDVVFVDFLHHNARHYWNEQLQRFYDQVPFDGLWLDMNEITSFCNGVCYNDQRYSNPVDNRLFYWPGGRDLEYRTTSLDARHETGDLELDVHNLYGLLQSYYTSEYFVAKQGIRPFVLSRSTFTGSGKYAAHWLGDNDSHYSWMKMSITGIHLFNMFGIPFSGADVCGFKGNTTAYDCAAWYKLAAVYPFSRNHNNLDTISQEPYVEMFNSTIDDVRNTTAFDVIKKAMFTKYGLHVYTYTQFHKHATGGSIPFKPLFFGYPNEDPAYNEVQFNVLLGDYIKASTAVEIYTRESFYFPEIGSLWCPIWEGVFKTCIQGGSTQSFNVPPSEIMLHMKWGSIIPLQLTNSSEFNTITDVTSLQTLKNRRTDLAILLDGDNKAKGDVRFDSGSTLDLTQYDEIIFTATAVDPFFGYPTMDIIFNVTRAASTGAQTNSMKLGDILLYNTSRLSFLGRTTGTVTLTSGKFKLVKGIYDSKNNILRLAHDGLEDLYFKDIAKIHLEANQ